MKECKFCKTAREDVQFEARIVSVVVDGEAREVVLWTDHVHVSCAPEAVAEAKAALRERQSS
jgi:hypothetical protein